jgi:hypothetical protein
MSDLELFATLLTGPVLMVAGVLAVLFVTRRRHPQIPADD